MWAAYRQASQTGRAPHKCFPGFKKRWGKWVAYQFDSAVLFFGTIIDNALAERNETKIGDKTEWKPKYTILTLLNPRFRLPAPPPEPSQEQSNPWATILALADNPNSGVKRWVYVPPQEETGADVVSLEHSA